MPTSPKCSSGRMIFGGLERPRLSCLLCFSLLAAIPASYAVAQQPNLPTKLALSKPGETGGASLVLGPGDLIDLQVFDTPELSAKLRIAQDGSIAMPVVGMIKIGGLTTLQADAVIEQKLRDAQIMISPSVTILVTDYATQGIDVLGEVKAPGIYNFLGTHSLYDALSAAGGVTPAEGSTITVTHHDDPDHPVIVRVTGPNFSETQRATRVEPGDVVDVSRAEAIYVVGDVGHSGQFPIAFGRPLTALDALALAQGPNRTAKLGKASIVRKTATGAELIPVDLHLVEKNAAPNPVLQADDVLVIPRSGLRGFLDLVLPGATDAVIGAVAYGYIRE